jgi:peptidyl-prolyl cis-trans isomerase D
MDTVRAEVAAEKLASDPRVRDRVNQLHDRVESLRSDGRTLEQAAAELKLTLRRVEAADAQGRDRQGQPVDLPESTEIVRAVFASDRGVDNEAIKTRANGWIWFEVTGVERSRERAYEEVRDQVADAWRRDEAARLTQERANELLKKVEGGAKLEDVAAEAGVTVETLEGVTRSGREAISASAAAIAFTLDEGALAVAPAAQGRDRLLMRMTARSVPVFDPAAADIASLRRNLDSALANELVDRYVARLQTEIGATINERAFAIATGAQTTR